MTKPPVSALEYSQRFARALAVNADGRSAVDGPNCGLTCATPEDVLDMLQHADPGANLTSVSQLPAFIAHLVVRAAPEGEWMMACKGGNGDVNAAPIWNCMSRHFHAGEQCLADSQTNRCVFAFDCGNVVGIEIHEADCIELHVGLKAGDEIHIGALGPAAFPTGRCGLMIQKTGEDEHGTPALDECPRSTCNYAADSAYLHMPVLDQPRISWVARTDGDNVIRLPREFLAQSDVLALCVITADGHQTLARVITRHSFVNDRSYVLYHGWRLSSAWQGTPYEWHFAGEALPHLTPQIRPLNGRTSN